MMHYDQLLVYSFMVLEAPLDDGSPALVNTCIYITVVGFCLIS